MSATWKNRSKSDLDAVLGAASPDAVLGDIACPDGADSASGFRLGRRRATLGRRGALLAGPGSSAPDEAAASGSGAGGGHIAVPWARTTLGDRTFRPFPSTCGFRGPRGPGRRFTNRFFPAPERGVPAAEPGATGFTPVRVPIVDPCGWHAQREFEKVFCKLSR